VSRTRIKFCGLTRAEDIDRAVALGVDAVGLILAARSPRRVDVAAAASLRQRVPPFVSVIALVMDEELTSLRAILERVKPDLFQFHGQEPESDCRALGPRYLKAVPMGEGGDAEAFMARYPLAAGFVLDSHTLGQPGGSGSAFDWSRWPARSKRPLLLAGGLSPDNVGEAVRRLRPYAVDVSSGIESSPGIKDARRMQQFIDEVHRADADHH
jgi:phosphoribosylanthranilate isomerase